MGLHFIVFFKQKVGDCCKKRLFVIDMIIFSFLPLCISPVGRRARICGEESVESYYTAFGVEFVLSMGSWVYPHVGAWSPNLRLERVEPVLSATTVSGLLPTHCSTWTILGYGLKQQPKMIASKGKVWRLHDKNTMKTFPYCKNNIVKPMILNKEIWLEKQT